MNPNVWKDEKDAILLSEVIDNLTREQDLVATKDDGAERDKIKFPVGSNPYLALKDYLLEIDRITIKEE